MAINWDQVPLEMKEVVVSEMDVKTSFLFIISFIPDCKTNETISVRAKDGRGSIRYSQMDYSKYLTVTDWRQTIWNVMSLIGTKIEVDSLELILRSEYQDFFNWFRNNFHIKPQLVKINNYSNCCYNESILDWPSDTKIKFNVANCRLPNLESFNNYEKIVALHFDAESAECAHSMTDDILKKMRNVKHVELDYSAVTMNGFSWWIKNWLTRKDDNEQYRFRVRWYEGDPFSFENVTNILLDVIGKTEKVYEKDFYEEYWKIEINKNGKVGGTINLLDNALYFESEKITNESKRQGEID